MACEHKNMTAHYDWEQTLVCDDCQKSEAEILREHLNRRTEQLAETQRLYREKVLYTDSVLHDRAKLKQLLACEKTALDDEKAEHALTRAENQRLREAAEAVCISVRESGGSLSVVGTEALEELAVLLGEGE